MSVTGKFQAIAARGYRLRWSVEATVEPDYDNLTLALVDAKGSIVLSNSQRVKARGGVVTKESEEAQRNALITWAEEATRAPIQPPSDPMSEPPAPKSEDEGELVTVTAAEGEPNG